MQVITDQLDADNHREGATVLHVRAATWDLVVRCIGGRRFEVQMFQLGPEGERSGLRGMALVDTAEEARARAREFARQGIDQPYLPERT